MLTLDTNLQYLIKQELEQSMKDFKAVGAGGLLMDVKTGEVYHFALQNRNLFCCKLKNMFLKKIWKVLKI